MKINDIAAVNAFAPVLDDLGTPRFDRAFMTAINEIVVADHFTFFAYTARDGLSLLAIASRHDTTLNRSLTRDYIKDYHKLDPNFADLSKRGSSRKIVVRRHDPSRLKTRAYQKRFFAAAGLVDKISYIWRQPEIAYYINIYRAVETGRYTAGDAMLLGGLAPFLTRLMRRHADHIGFTKSLRHNDPRGFIETLVRLSGQDLTPRERQVCSRILLGLSADGIALDLGIGKASVITFRRRAYAKLGISTQAELFALCLRALPLTSN